ISEGFGRYSYDDATARFAALIVDFIDLDRFEDKEIGRAISALHDAERNGTPEVRSHRVGYQSRGGRMVEATSASTNTSVVGEEGENLIPVEDLVEAQENEEPLECSQCGKTVAEDAPETVVYRLAPQAAEEARARRERPRRRIAVLTALDLELETVLARLENV